MTISRSKRSLARKSRLILTFSLPSSSISFACRKSFYILVSGSSIFCPLLLHSLVLGKPQANPLCHLDVSCPTVLRARNLRFVQGLGTKGADTALKTSLHQSIVHTGNSKIIHVRKRTYPIAMVGIGPTGRIDVS